ncbi:MAG: hypothetical protein ACFHWX_20665 [Bacteroidota bacterium]
MINPLRNYRLYLALLYLFVLQQIQAQNISIIDFGGFRPVIISEKLPEDFTSSRSVVIISAEEDPDKQGFRPDWQKFAEKIHSNLRMMYIDPICYVYIDDLNAGPDVKAAFIAEFKSRGVKNLIFVERKFVGLNEAYSIKIAKFNGQSNLIAETEKVWMQKDAPFDLIMLRLGRQIIRQNIERSNFLIPETPNILSDLPLFPGVHFSAYPGLIRRANLAVIIPEKYPLYNGISQDEIAVLEQENLRIERKIQEIESLMSLYPYKYELVSYTDDEALYKKGFQFALLPIHTTGTNIKNMLNYKISGTETDFISMVPKDGIGMNLKTIPVNQTVNKYYIKQTIAHDVYVGKEWDSDYSWESAFRNFIINLSRALK